MQNTQRKTIAFSVTLIKSAEEHAKTLGMDFADYVRYLLIKNTEEKMDQKEPVYYMSEETEKNVAKARKEYRQGKYKTFSSGKNLMKYLLSKK